jgi:hypothetical protein
VSALHWTDETDAEADAYFATLSEAEIRRRQDLCREQQRTAFERRNTNALIDLQRMDDALARAMMARLIRSNGGLET